MNRLVATTALALLAATSISAVEAASYSPPRLTHVVANSDGTVFIKWTGSPTPGPCGANSGWVKILPSANEALKSLAFSMYFSGVPARVDTSGCDGTYEVVGALYTPTG